MSNTPSEEVLNASNDADLGAREIVLMFMDFYRSAEGIEDATNYFTTAEIIDFCLDIRPGIKVDYNLVFDALEASGYNYGLISDKSLRWLVIVK